MLSFLAQLLDTSDFPARWYCGNWSQAHGWLHILSDLGVWLAYVAIPCVLGFFVLRRQHTPFRAIFLLFGAFILACGTTHLMEAMIFWWPAYRLAGLVKLSTAVVSWGTVAALITVTPRALAMRSPDELQHEIDARKAAEDALQRANEQLDIQLKTLRASEERFRRLVEGTRDYAIFMLDPTGRIVSWNPGAQRIKQYAVEEIIGKHFSVFCSADDVAACKPDRELAIATAEGRFEEEGWRYRKDGSRFWANVVITALRDEDGKLLGFSKITRDMTERKQGEENARRLVEEETARRAAEDLAVRIKEEQERLRVTLHSIGDAVIATDTAGNVSFMNPVAETLTGWSEHEGAYGQPLATVFHIVNERTRQPAENPVAQALREGAAVGLTNHTVLIARDGKERPIADSAAPIRDRNGVITGVVLVFRDVTGQRKAEEADRRNREILQLVHQIGKIGHWEWDPLTDENTWSPELEALYGLPPGGFDGGYKGWIKHIHPGDVARAEEELRRALETGEYFTDFRVVWPDGSVHWLETRAHVFKDLRDQSIRFVGVNMDITERKKQQEALQASELRWRTLAEALPNLVWTDLPDGQCDWLSSQWGKYTGIPEHELLGLHWLETLHPDDREPTLACWKAACEDRGVYDVEYRIRRHDGEYRWFKTRGVPIRDNEGKIVYWFGTCTDIEDVKRMQAALREADRRKNEFLATLAHELRNPLAPLRTGLHLLRLTKERAGQDQALKMMDRQLSQMVRLIDDLLDISRITHNKLELRKAHVPLSSVIENAVETARPLIDARGHTLTINLPAERVLLDADLTRLSQVFWNLLSNSAKYTDPGGRIELFAECRDGEVEVRVKDNGIGIPADAIPRLFTLFSQVNRGADRAQGGLGIGLALVKGLVEMHGGRVCARSAGQGEGSEFVVRLPLVRTERPPAAAPPAADGAAACAPRRVLVVDDNRDDAASLGMLLSIEGHDARTAHDGIEALELAEAFRPDVILLDLGLPKLNGHDTCRRIRQEPWGQSICIVAVTGWGHDDDRLRSREAGFDHHLVKPIDPAALEQVLRDLAVPSPRAD
jgi:PAS domain S-box-containing protein